MTGFTQLSNFDRAKHVWRKRNNSVINQPRIHKNVQFGGNGPDSEEKRHSLLQKQITFGAATGLKGKLHSTAKKSSDWQSGEGVPYMTDRSDNTTRVDADQSFTVKDS